MIANIKSLTTGVGDLTKKVNDLYAALNKVNIVAETSFKKASSIVNTTGGSMGLTQAATRPGTGADGAKFPVRYGEGYGAGYGAGYPSNYMQGSLAAFALGGSNPALGATVMGSPGAALRYGAVQATFGIASGAMQMMPNLNDTLVRTYGYYQAGLRSPGINRNQLERATFSGMRGGLSSAGSDAQTAAILAGMGYTPGSANYLQAVGQVGGAYKYLGMNNAAATQAIAGFQSGPTAANLFQYGITTFDAATGKEKTTGQLARELMTYMTGGAKVSAEDVRRSYQKGALGANLRTMGFSSDQQSLLYQAMIDLASGRNPDLQNASPVKGNENTFLTAQGRMNASTTDVMMSAEQSMIKGFENAADTVEFFNRQLKNAAGTLGYISGYGGGVTGTPAGKGAGKILKNIGGILLMAGGAAVTGMSFGSATPVGLGMMATGASLLGGGGTGFGASFGVNSRSGRGGSSPSSGAGVTAGYGATDTTGSSPWASTNGTHTGIDYAMPVGTPVKSAFDGVVSAVNINADYGTSIMVDNINGTQAIYGHLSEKRVKVGDQISQGQVIGKSGQSGNADGPHLHFEVRDAKNHPVNPEQYMSGEGYAGKLFGNYSTILPTYQDLAKTKTSASSSGALTIGSYSGSKDALSNTDLRAVLSKAGFKGSSLETAMAVVRAESGGIPGRHSDPSLKLDDSYGLFQINMLGDLGTRRNANYLKEYGKYGYTGPESLYNPEINARIAYDISKGGKKWSDAWVNTSKKLNIGGGSTGYGAAISAPQTVTPFTNKTVNVTLKIERASEQEAVRLAKRVKYYLEHDNEITTMGRA